MDQPTEETVSGADYPILEPTGKGKLPSVNAPLKKDAPTRKPAEPAFRPLKKPRSSSKR